MPLAIGLVTVLALAACGGEAGDSSDASPDEIEIGSIGPFTGPNAALGEQWRNGVTLAVEEINAAGGIKSLGGAKLKVLEGDHTGKPEVGASQTERVVQDGAVAVLGALESGVTLVSSQVTERQGVPYIVPLSSSTEVTSRGFKRLFRIIEGSDAGARTAASQLKELTAEHGLSAQRIAVIHEDSTFGTSIGTNTEKALKEQGLNVVTRMPYNAESADLTPEVSKLKAMNPDILVMSSYYNDAALILRAMQQLDFNVNAIFGVRVGPFTDPKFHQQMGAVSDYVFNSDVGMDEVSERGKAISATYQKRFDRPLAVLALYPYVSVYVLADALERAGSTDKEKLTEALRATSITDMPLAAGAIKFDDAGNNTGGLSVLSQAVGGKLSVVFPAEYAVAEPTLPVPAWKQR
ncbi:branched-chain amino acid ABC transporter substrate-binding protein [Phytohabitans suffuscus]|uniref:Branched-chain amino acid ABC transporter substrate-binding protein n=1 Tax=Phytohabitans suffuscus TaxID=624315 RepID=A0A6F8YVF2_9ACTN|nr:branched-chain amino acid ABC transporter substrate-binding protein [Phytohabitans suffuscus]